MTDTLTHYDSDNETTVDSDHRHTYVERDEVIVTGSGLPRFDILNATTASLPPHVAEQHIRDVALIFLPGIDEDVTSFGDTLADETLAYLRTQLSTTAKAVKDMKMQLHLTWSEMAQLFGVSRRAVHNWANGAAMNSRNEWWLDELTDHLIVGDVTPDAARRRLMHANASEPSLFRQMVRERESQRGERHLTGAARFAGADPDLSHEQVAGVERDPSVRRSLPTNS